VVLEVFKELQAGGLGGSRKDQGGQEEEGGEHRFEGESVGLHGAEVSTPLGNSCKWKSSAPPPEGRGCGEGRKHLAQASRLPPRLNKPAEAVEGPFRERSGKRRISGEGSSMTAIGPELRMEPTSVDLLVEGAT